jgi:hypothetical protein
MTGSPQNGELMPKEQDLDDEVKAADSGAREALEPAK